MNTAEERLTPDGGLVTVVISRLGLLWLVVRSRKDGQGQKANKCEPDAHYGVRRGAGLLDDRRRSVLKGRVGADGA